MKVELDLVALAKRCDGDPQQDPLADDKYKPHRRAERQEKQARNTDKERAMHEKSELERLHAELKGPDWLRALGISGITETQKRGLEATRDLFITRVIGLLERFTAWKEREKEVRLQRQKRLQYFERPSVEVDSGQVSEEEADDGNGREQSKGSLLKVVPDSEASDAGQSSSAGTKRSKKGAQRAKAAATATSRTNKGQAVVKEEEEPPPPFLSFFAKKHQRAAAFAGHRRGRNVIAFGHPIPEMPEAPFQLPDELYPGYSSLGRDERRRGNDDDHEHTVP